MTRCALPRQFHLGRPPLPAAPLRHHPRYPGLQLREHRGNGPGTKVVIGKSKVRIGVAQPTTPALGTSWASPRTLSGKVENRFHMAMGTVTAGIDFYDRESTYSDDTQPGITDPRAISASMRRRLDPTEHLSLSFGLRYDRQDFTGTSGWEGDFSGFSGNVSLAWQVTEALTLRGRVSSVFGGLSIEDNFIYNPAWVYDGCGPRVRPTTRWASTTRPACWMSAARCS